MEDLKFNFELLTNKLFQKRGFKFMVHSSVENQEKVSQALHTFMEKFRKKYRLFDGGALPIGEDSEFALDTQKEFHLLPNFINYCARSYTAPGYLNLDTPKLQLAGMLTRQVVTGRVPTPANPGKGRCLWLLLPIQLRRQLHHELIPGPQHPQILRKFRNGGKRSRCRQLHVS